MKLRNCCDISVEREGKQHTIRGIYLFISNVVLISMTYGILTRTHFSIDSYSIIYRSGAAQDLKLGRFLGYLIDVVIEKMNVNIVKEQGYFTMLFIVIIAISTTLLIKIFANQIEHISYIQLIGLNLAIDLSFINVYILEWFLYPEMALYFGLALISVVLAVFCLSKDFRFKNILLSFVFLCMSLNLYQANIGAYIIFGLTFVFVKNKAQLTKISVLQSIKVIGIGLLSSILCVVSMNISRWMGLTLGSSRDASLNFMGIMKNVITLFWAQRSIWISGSGFMPVCSILILGLLLVALLIYVVRANKFNVRNILYMILLLIANYLIVFAPHLIAGEIWLAPRTLVPFFMFLSSMAIVFFSFYHKNLKLARYITVCLFLFLSVNFFQIQDITINHYSNNKIDREIITNMYDRIMNYEQQYGVKIKKVSIQNDINPTYGYYGSVNYILFDTNVRAPVVSWASVNALNYISGRSFEAVEMDPNIYQSKFKDKDWNYFKPEEQMLFMNDTVYIMSY